MFTLVEGLFETCYVRFDEIAKFQFQPIFYSERRKEFWQTSLRQRPNGDTEGVLAISHSDVISVFCNDNGIEGYDGNPNLLRAKCDHGALKVHVEDEDAMDAPESEIVNFSALKCRSVKSAELKYTSRKCGPHRGSRIIKVAYQVMCGSLAVYETCHDADHRINHYTHHRMTPANSKYQGGYRDEDWNTGDLYKYEGLTKSDVTRMYTKKSVKAKVQDILGVDSTNVVLLRTNKYIARGHLMANVDGALHIFQKASFMYLNIMPQYQINNGGNWKRMEDALRNFVGNYGGNLDIYTGTADVMTQDGAPLYLYNENESHKFPIQNYFYKIIVSETRFQAMVVVCINNAEVRWPESERFIHCRGQIGESPDPDISDVTGLFTGNFDEAVRHNYERGYMYTCTIQSFLRAMRWTRWKEFRKYQGFNIMRLPPRLNFQY